MSFLGSLWGGIRRVGIGVDKVTNVLEPFLVFIPEPAKTVLKVIIQLEDLIKKDGQGPVKKELALKIITTSFPNIDQGKLASNVDKLVEVLNDLSNAVPEEKQ